MLDKVLTWLANIWVLLIAIITIFDFIGIFIRAPTAWGGLMGSFQELMNYRLYTTIAIFSAPALLMIWWRARRRESRSALK
jgi:hypothetical protein